MVEVVFDLNFKKLFSKIKNKSLKQKIINQIIKIEKNPRIGKSMKYARKGTRELYIKPFRLSYAYHIYSDTLFILDLYHKKKQ